MVKPETFQTPLITLRNTPYDMLTGHSEGGVLGRGRVIWTPDPSVPSKRPRSTTAFVEEIGTVIIDGRWLKSA